MYNLDIINYKCKFKALKKRTKYLACSLPVYRCGADYLPQNLLYSQLCVDTGVVRPFNVHLYIIVIK